MQGIRTAPYARRILIAESRNSNSVKYCIRIPEYTNTNNECRVCYLKLFFSILMALFSLGKCVSASLFFLAFLDRNVLLISI